MLCAIMCVVNKTIDLNRNEFLHLFLLSDSSTKVGDVCGVQDEGISHGRPDSRQKEVP